MVRYMFDGHKFYILQREWVFDLTDGLGYQVSFDKSGNIVGYKQQFAIFADQEAPESLQSVPKEVLDKSFRIMQKHKELALV